MPILYETHATQKSLEATLLEQGATMSSEDGGLAVSTWLDTEPGELDEKWERLGRLVQEVRARVERRQRKSCRFKALAVGRELSVARLLKRNVELDLREIPR